MKKKAKVMMPAAIVSLAIALLATYVLLPQAARARQIVSGDHTPQFARLPLHEFTSGQELSREAMQGKESIPTWSSSFSYNAQHYPYTMVGTNPQLGSATTIVPVDIVPLTFTFSNGATVDGSAVADKIVASPLFQHASYTTGDNTQYVDAMQRAEFWNSISTRSPHYHLLLGQPIVHPAVTLHVPLTSGLLIGHASYINIDWFAQQSDRLAATSGIPPTHLLIFAAPDSHLYSLNHCCAYIEGFHTAVQQGNGIYTYTYASYNQVHNLFNVSDIEALSHELAEWANDPFTNNLVPNWSTPLTGCDNMLEVGDPLVGTRFTLNGYHVQDEAYFSWFAREEPSQGFRGQYSYRGTFTRPASDCPH